MMEFKHAIEWLHPAVGIIDLISGIILIGGFIVGIIKFVGIIFMERHKQFTAYQMLRRSVGIYIILGLEFMIIADLLDTLLDHSLSNMLSLGLIVIIRTILSYFLGKEMLEAKEEIIESVKPEQSQK